MRRIPVMALSTILLFNFVPVAQASSFTLKVELTIEKAEYFSGAFDEDPEDENASDNYVPTSSDLASALEDCKGGYSGWNGGLNSPIKVTNESGKIVGLGKLTKAFVWQNPEIYPDHFQCKYLGSVKVSSAKIYKIYVNNHSGPDYSFADFKKNKWSIKLVL